jgi:hypothetical protein
MDKVKFGPVFHNDEDPEELEEASISLNKTFLGFYALCKKGVYKDTPEDFQKFSNAEWINEEKLQKKQKEHDRVNGD